MVCMCIPITMLMLKQTPHFPIKKIKQPSHEPNCWPIPTQCLGDLQYIVSRCREMYTNFRLGVEETGVPLLDELRPAAA